MPPGLCDVVMGQLMTSLLVLVLVVAIGLSNYVVSMGPPCIWSSWTELIGRSLLLDALYW